MLAIRGGYGMARGWHYTNKLSLYRVPYFFYLFLAYGLCCCSFLFVVFVLFLFRVFVLFSCSRWSFVDVPRSDQLV